MSRRIIACERIATIGQSTMLLSYVSVRKWEQWRPSKRAPGQAALRKGECLQAMVFGPQYLLRGGCRAARELRCI